MLNDPLLYIVLILIVLIFKLADPLFYRLFPGQRGPVDVDWAISTAIEEGVLLVNNMRRNGELNGGAAAYTFNAAQHALNRLKARGIKTETVKTLEPLVKIAYERQRVETK